MNMKILFVIGLMALLIVGCDGAPPANPPVTPPSEFTEEQSNAIALEFLKNDETYKFDGIESTLNLEASEKFAYLDNAWTFTYSFDSAHAGYGDREGQTLAQAITPHMARILVVEGSVTSANLDAVESTTGQYWDMISEKSEAVPSPPAQEQPAENSLEAQAMKFCGKENVAEVYVCGDYYGVVGSLLGGGTTFYKSDGTKIICPVVGPDSMSDECKQFLLGSNCAQADICAPTAMPGSDSDEHGCIGSAGYTWCESSQKCVRPWEEETGSPCSSNPSNSINAAAGESFKIVLFSNPTTGFDWLPVIDNEIVVQYVNSTCIGCELDSGGLAGAGHNFAYEFKALKAGTAKITMRYMRSWESVPPTDERNFTVTAT